MGKVKSGGEKVKVRALTGKRQNKISRGLQIILGGNNDTNVNYM